MMVIGLLLAGLVLLLLGGNLFVDSAVWLAERTGIPKVIVGATVVSLATTTPEMIVSFVAAAQGSIDISIGNAVGSATVNMGLVMALSALFLPIPVAGGGSDRFVRTVSPGDYHHLGGGKKFRELP